MITTITTTEGWKDAQKDIDESEDLSYLVFLGFNEQKNQELMDKIHRMNTRKLKIYTIEICSLQPHDEYMKITKKFGVTSLPTFVEV